MKRNAGRRGIGLLLSGRANDERVAAKVLPAIGEMAAKNTAACGLSPLADLARQLPSATPAVQQTARETFTKTYAAIPNPLMAPGGANLATGSDQFRGTVAGLLKAIPGGADVLEAAPKSK